MPRLPFPSATAVALWLLGGGWTTVSSHRFPEVPLPPRSLSFRTFAPKTMRERSTKTRPTGPHDPIVYLLSHDRSYHCELPSCPRDCK